MTTDPYIRPAQPERMMDLTNGIAPRQLVLSLDVTLHPHPPTSDYVEAMWTASVGPTAVLVARRIAVMLGDLTAPAATIDTAGLAATLGVSAATLCRSLDRLQAFRLGGWDLGDDGANVRQAIFTMKSRWPEAPAKARALVGALRVVPL